MSTYGDIPEYKQINRNRSDKYQQPIAIHADVTTVPHQTMYLIESGAGPRTVVLSNASLAQKGPVIIKHISGGNDITIETESASTAIDTVAPGSRSLNVSKTENAQACVTFVSDGLSWYVTNVYVDSIDGTAIVPYPILS